MVVNEHIVYVPTTGDLWIKPKRAKLFPICDCLNCLTYKCNGLLMSDLEYLCGSGFTLTTVAKDNELAGQICSINGDRD